MSKLLEDPKVAALVNKQVAAAIKAHKTNVLGAIKAQLNESKGLNDKLGHKAVTTHLKAVEAVVKAA